MSKWATPLTWKDARNIVNVRRRPKNRWEKAANLSFAAVLCLYSRKRRLGLALLVVLTILGSLLAFLIPMIAPFVAIPVALIIVAFRRLARADKKRGKRWGRP